MVSIQTSNKFSLRTRVMVVATSLLVPLLAAVGEQNALMGAISIVDDCPTPCYTSGPFQKPEIEGVKANASIKDIILNVIGFILDLVLILAVLMLIIAGVYLITSLGDESNKEKAKKIVIYVIIGIILVIFARGIVVFVNNYFGAT